jgi:solute:Na+ symporter, SSS family
MILWQLFLQQFSVATLQWVFLIAGFALLFLIAPRAISVQEFFKGSSVQHEPSYFALVSSLVISWIFAKSIMNAADLGFSFGIVGGVGYGMYYMSFFVVGLVVSRLRNEFGFESLHEYMQSSFGKIATHIFSFLLIVRLFNEVWSNAMVIGLHFGPLNSVPYISSILVFTGLTLAYTLKGGMKSSIFTDIVQMLLFSLLLLILMGMVFPSLDTSYSTLKSTSIWSWETGLNFMAVALLQSFSYGFHDPVMTDRAFITSPKKMLRSFFLAGVIGFLLIVVFSFIGTISQQLPGEGLPPTSRLANYFGLSMLLLINVIMLTSASSTLDSTFTSFTKLVTKDIAIIHPTKLNLWKGRIIMAILAVLGIIPLIFSPTLLAASTVSGTMVLGLAPIFLFPIKRKRVAPWLFILPVMLGFLCGLAYLFLPENSQFYPTEGPYASLLFINLLAFTGCFSSYFILRSLIYAKDSADSF